MESGKRQSDKNVIEKMSFLENILETIQVFIGLIKEILWRCE